jgi:hypothetical protein
MVLFKNDDHVLDRIRRLHRPNLSRVLQDEVFVSDNSVAL